MLEPRIVLDSTVVFNEIMYHPRESSEVEWVELHNQNAVDMDVSGWRIDGGIKFDFAEGTVIPGQGFAVVASDPDRMGGLDESVPVLGPFEGRLGNGGEQLRLLNNIDSFVTRQNSDDVNLPDVYWSVDLQGVGGVIANPNPPVMSGPDTATGLGGTWNEAAVAGHSGTSINPVFANLVDQSGAVTDVAFSIQGTVSGWANANGDALVDDYLFVNAGNADSSARWGLSGLTPGATYELQAFGGVSRDASITVDTDGDGLLTDESATNVTGAGHLFEQITTDANGMIIGSIAPGAAGEANWSGFHLIEGVLNGDNQQPSQTRLSGNEGRRTMDLLDYSDGGEWPVAPDGSGASLAKRRLDLGTRDVANWTSSIQVGGTPGRQNFASGEMSVPSIAFNEFGAENDEFQFELHNFGSEDVPLAGVTIGSGGGQDFAFTNQSISSGGFLSVTEAELGFPVAPGQELFLYSSDKESVIDAVRTSSVPKGRMPDGTGRWLTPRSPTFSAANQFSLNDDIVINEVQYHGYPDRGTADIPAEFEVSTLIEVDSNWRYNLNASNQGLATGWANESHPIDDDTWREGPGLIGFMSRPDRLPADLNTNTGDPRDNDPRVTTYYFETEFEFGGDTEEINLQLDSVIDDGAVFYLNGVEVLRQNMPSGEIGPLTRATPGVSAAAFSGPTTISTDSLVAGTNRLSAEVHQSTPSSSDIIFGAKLQTRTKVTDTIPGLPYRENEEEWIELLNRGAETVDLSEWSLADGIEFEFPSQTSMRPGEFLVIANDAAALASKHPDIADRIVGSFSGRLNNQSDTIRVLDQVGNPVDELTYFDGGRWPSSPDGGGTTLELRDPDSDNSIAESWSASNETSKSEWKTYTYRGVATDDGLGNDIFHEFVLGLLGEGEILLDDIQVTEDPSGDAISLLQNGAFESDTIGEIPDAWRIIGTHGDHGKSNVVVDPSDSNNRVLHLVTTGPTEDKHNHASTTYADGRELEVGKEYEISYRAKWLSGSNQVNTRLYFNFLQATTLIDVPETSGTPGLPNTSRIENSGPTYIGFKHGPVVPDETDAVTVSVAASDPDGVATMQLYYSVDGDDFAQVAMTDNGAGQFVAAIPPQSARSIVQFYVSGTDSLGAESAFPVEGPDSRALYVVQDDRANLGDVHNLRFVMTSDDTSFMYRNINRMSNDRRGATIIYDETEVFYDVDVRLKGSAFGRNNNAVAGLNIRFHPDQLFRGVHETLSIERSGNRKELVAKHMLNRAAGGLTSFYDDVAHVITPRRSDTGVGLLAMARTTDVYLDSLYENGGSSPLYNLELLYSPTGTVGRDPEAPKINFPYTHDNGRPQFEDLGADKETYRWNFQMRNARGRDDYRPLINTAQAFSLSGSQLEAAAAEVIDVDQWMRTFAMLSLNGNDDVYTRLWEHNFRAYSRPEDGKLVAIPWDLDRAFNLSASASAWGIANNAGVRNNVANIIEVPVNTRLFWGHILDIANTTANSEYMEYWTTHYATLARQSFSSELRYIDQRATRLLRQLPEAVEFEITSNGGNDITTDEQTVTLQGKGWINVREFQLNGGQSVEATWLDGESWSVVLPLELGVNNIRLTALDHQGQVVGEDAISVQSTAANPVAESLRVTEINFNPYAPTTEERNVDPTLSADDFEFVEVQNVGTSIINLQNVSFASGIEFDFPNISLQAGEYGVIVRNAAAFAIRYPGVDVLGEFDGGLNNGGERLTVESSDGTIILDVEYGDRDPWYQRADGVGATIELVDANSTPSIESGEFYRWQGSSEFGGTPGGDGQGSNGVVINEVLSNSDAANTFDSIELFNTSATSVDVSGWYLSDESSNLLKFQIPSETVLAPGEYVVFDERSFNAAEQGANAFSLNGNDGDDVWLVATDASGQLNSFIDDVHFGPAVGDESFGRVLDTSRLAPMLLTTLGEINSPARVGPVVISEVHYNPGEPSGAALAIDATLSSGDLEFLEITNMSDEAVSLDGWRIRGGIDFEFPPTESLSPAASILIVRFDPIEIQNVDKLQAFRTHYSIDDSVAIIGGYSGQLSNRTDRVQIQRPGQSSPDAPAFVPATYEDEVTYTDRAKWPSSADGSGDSFQRITGTQWGNDPNAWTASSPTPGLFTATDADFNRDGVVDDKDIDLVAVGIQTSDIRFDLTGDGAVNVSDIEFIVESVLGTVIGDSNLDGVFDSSDFVQVFRAAEYEDDQTANSTWRDGDWNGDQEFGTRDLVFAFQKGSFTRAATAAVVPNAETAGSSFAFEISSWRAAEDGVTSIKIKENAVTADSPTPSDPPARIQFQETRVTEFIFAEHARQSFQRTDRQSDDDDAFAFEV